jgi:hypothetical protein
MEPTLSDQLDKIRYLYKDILISPILQSFSTGPLSLFVRFLVQRAD